MNAESYRTKFADSQLAAKYSDLYNPNTPDDILWHVEKVFLDQVVEELRQTHESIDYLDFACGTGRVIGYLENFVDTAAGIEISDKMISVAQQKGVKGNLICRDITDANTPIESKYDLITAFRFVLNAEPRLRHAGLSALVGRLKDQNSRLVFSNHGNPFSHKMLALPIHAIIRPFSKRYDRTGNYLTYAQVSRLVSDVGLEIVKVFGLGFISPKI
ncbi:MAG: class I SAM-dependent methyltransferase, partial [Planctomycetales bacterium]|nr:class I SAM-dependent methyltransferase [Planctomycetales bacterium]